MLDPEKIRRAMRVYRAIGRVGQVRRGFEEIQEGVGAHNRQVNAMLNASQLAERVREKRVDAQDVRELGRGAVKSVPNVYRVIAGHIRKHGAKRDAKT